ncbi:fumarylacetoacetate hydrolase family protein [Ornithinicoccus hortensis]|uniref:2-keto-4-pentenoate hydratase/2-oxohepta-3-ene-1,7-dioic acid hydratase in catechol pathway n=1 Tax=Ornithinicoccus hortensis TaxID=82346 RepID=A0A542YQW9_9MICO|nr:fumarylacetoacetate hydrolase family protein [Ornithinicoccus hortensis]TQL50496.1 2-keto-4-pentenoate hydratase/2-oxohepta-3-ene-1,7-dioic acid hydratase in catechol pathway [Ornithinicoccus hortensis]
MSAHFATITESGTESDTEQPVLVLPERGVIPFAALGDDVPATLLEAIRSERTGELADRAATAPDTAFRPVDGVTFTAPYRHPRMIWGIGLNYVDHAADLSESVPEEPASFIKLDHTVIGPGEPIPVPQQSERTTSEAEMGLVIGRHCRNVEPEEALDYVLGAVNVLDQTAEDILARNPRFLTRSKNFPGFFSFGPQIVPLEEVVAHAGSLEDIEVSTVVNDEQTRTNTVSRMRYSPAYLISFHSKVMPLQPGDILSPGTPGAIHVRPGDIAECRIPGLGVLRNPVVAG